MLKKIVLLGFVLFAFASIASAKYCKVKEKCKCTTNDGAIINLAALAGNNSKPRYNVHNDSTFTYYYNPCKPFSVGNSSAIPPSECQNVQVCQKISVSADAMYEDIGGYSTETFLSTPLLTDIVVQYTSSKPHKRLSQVTMKCNKSVTTPELVFKGTKMNATEYYFSLTHASFCPGYYPVPLIPASTLKPASTLTPPSLPSKGLSAGSVLLIIALVIVIVYIVVGIAYQKCYRNKHGSDAFPNKDFWIVLPDLIKDGFFATISVCTCQGFSTKRREYEDFDTAPKAHL